MYILLGPPGPHSGGASVPVVRKGLIPQMAPLPVDSTVSSMGPPPEPAVAPTGMLSRLAQSPLVWLLGGILLYTATSK
jgi:hypothetical protein